MSAPDGRFALFDADDGGAIVLSGYRRTISLDGMGGDLAAVFCAFAAASARGEWLALAADYELGASLEPALAASASAGVPGLCGWVFARAQRHDAKGVRAFLDARLALLTEHQRVAGVAELRAALDADEHGACVARIRRAISDGECYQINLTFPLDGLAYGHPLALYACLRERQPVRYGAFLATPEKAILSFSPELFFERRGSRVVTRPMKGTAPRGATPQEDRLRRSELLGSARSVRRTS